MGNQVVIDLAAAHDHSPHIFDGECVRIADHRVEMSFREILQLRHRFLVPKQALGRHHDERLAEIPYHLPPQQVEDLRRSRRHADLDIVLGAELQITFRTRR